MSRRLRLYLSDMLKAIGRIESYTSELTEQAFLDSELVLDACTRNFLVIGKAVKQLPEELRVQRPEVPWKSIAGLRDMLAHAYFNVDDGILWDIIQNDLEPLRKAVLFLLESLPEE